MSDTYETSDLSFAAFLCTRGVKLISASKDETGKFLFIFDIQKDAADSLQDEFLNSEFPIFDYHVKLLKRRIYKR